MSRVFQIGEEGLEDAGKTEQMLNEIGIATRKSATEFKSFEEIMSTVAEKFPTLTKVQQQNLLQTMGGTYHVGKLTGLMNNWNIVTDATTKALNSNGSALSENKKYLDSVEGKYQTFKTTLDGLYNKMLQSGAIKSTINGMTELLNTIDRVGTGLGTLGTIFLTIGIPAIGKFSTSVIATKVAMETATGTSVGLGMAMKTMLLNPVGLIITALVGLTAGIVAYVNHTQKIKEQAEKATKSQNDFNKSLQEFNKTLNPSDLNEFI